MHLETARRRGLYNTGARVVIACMARAKVASVFSDATLDNVLPFSELEIIKRVGCGAFGEVYEANYGSCTA